MNAGYAEPDQLPPQNPLARALSMSMCGIILNYYNGSQSLHDERARVQKTVHLRSGERMPREEQGRGVSLYMPKAQVRTQHKCAPRGSSLSANEAFLPLAYA